MNAPEDKTAALQKRKMRIVDAALTCFLENGYHQTGVRDIARKAGISLGNLYNHFPGKEAVLAEIAALDRQETQPFLDLLADHSQPEKTLKRFVSAYADYSAQPENVVLTTELVGESVHNPEIAALFSENWTSLVDALKNLLKAGMADGCFRAFSDPDETAEMIMDLLESLGLRLLLADGEKKKSAAIDALQDFIGHATRK
ncbi:TetR/AcrR family transcriptional regulator [Hoeflea poritis]|uniref:TetR/AcrR family transcriptional regulator n=1 Tax=Hoeflea poritis TaxID=2993659 RepID=A0ABT4VJN4_9HYPH|nr:TetR/AcrR family transcriptional regulator [Hoeflea poritis]MDA4844923.1 TetR/AcrR family transcriptional regulator [Hoeflea poritis]